MGVVIVWVFWFLFWRSLVRQFCAYGSSLDCFQYFVKEITMVAVTGVVLMGALRRYHPWQLGLFSFQLKSLSSWLLAVLAAGTTLPFIEGLSSHPEVMDHGTM